MIAPTSATDRPPRTVLLWKIGALGDVVMTTPLVRQLRRHWSDAKIDYLTGKESAVVLEGNPNLDSVLTFDEKILANAQLGRLNGLRRQLSGYDVIFVLDKHWVFATLACAARVPRRIGFSRRAWEGMLHTQKVAYGPVRHEIDYYLDLAGAAGVDVDRADTRLELPEAIPCDLPNRPYVVLINSGGVNARESSTVRRMPDTLFRHLVALCAQRATIVFLGAPAERRYYEDLSVTSAVNLCGRTTLRQSWFILQHAAAVYTTDTGLMHMAAAVNPGVTAVFGPTNPARKAPPGARWAWSDADAYSEAYEVFGTVPTGSYFGKLKATDIFQTDDWMR